MSESRTGRPSEAMRSAFGESPTLDEMVENSARTMEQRLGGRPTLSEGERKRTTSVSLSPRSLAYLSGVEETSRLSRSEIIEMLIELNRNDPGPLLAALRGEPSSTPLSDAEIAAAAKIASDAVSAWTSARATVGERIDVSAIGEVVHTLYAAAIAAVRENR